MNPISNPILIKSGMYFFTTHFGSLPVQHRQNIVKDGRQHFLHQPTPNDVHINVVIPCLFSRATWKTSIGFTGCSYWEMIASVCYFSLVLGS